MPSFVQQDVDRLIITVRGQRVILDSDLAKLYGVSTKVLNQAVKRNKKRFPEDFLFQLERKEAEQWQRSRSQIVTLKHGKNSKSQFAILKQGENLKYLPYAFTEHGAMMAANLLKSPKAVAMSVYVIRAFIRLRQFALSVNELAEKLNALEKKYEKHDHQFKIVFETVRQLMVPPSSPRRKIGFSRD